VLVEHDARRSVFVAVAALFVTMAQRMGKEMAALPPLRGYTFNIAGSLAGVAAFAVISWLQLSPAWWFGIAFISAVPLLVWSEPATDGALPASTGQRQSLAGVAVSLALLAISLGIVQVMARGAIWSPYYKITVAKDGADTVVEVNNIFHQSMAPVEQKEYFYQWPYAVFGDTFDDVLILGAGSGTDVAAALRHGAKHVDAVEIDPAIMRLGRERHPDRPYSDPRVTLVNDDARHYLRTTTKKDLVVSGLIDSLTMQSSFSGVRLESYMFTTESFRAVRDHLKPDGLLVVYNYFRERWLVDRLANTAAAAFGQEPRVHVHEARAYLGVMLAGPRLGRLTGEPYVPDRVTAFNQSHAPALHASITAIPRSSLPAMTGPSCTCATASCRVTTASHWPSSSSCPPSSCSDDARAGRPVVVAVLPARRRLHAARVEVDHPVRTVVGFDLGRRVAGDCVRAHDGPHRELHRLGDGDPAAVAGRVCAGCAARRELSDPDRPVGFESRGPESLFYAVLVFSPILCAGLLFGSAIKRSTSLARDYGTNLLGAMLGGVGEYLSLVTGFRVLLFLIAACYVGALLARGRERGSVARVGAIGESVIG
jgi:spermidine synthase